MNEGLQIPPGDKNPQPMPSSSKERAGIIRAVNTPLGYITLFTLCIEPMFALIIYRYSGNDQVQLYALGLVFLMSLGSLISVIGMAIFRPAALRGESSEAQHAFSKEIQKGQKVVVLKPRQKTVLVGKQVMMWSSNRNKYIGRLATVSEIDKKAQVVRLDIDFGNNEWAFSWLYWR